LNASALSGEGSNREKGGLHEKHVVKDPCEAGSRKTVSAKEALRKRPHAPKKRKAGNRKRCWK